MADVMRILFRGTNAMNSSLYRGTGGRWGGKVRGMPVLLITVPGRKTGVKHTNPVVYLEDDGRYVVTGSAGGSAAEPQWFRNLRRSDEAEIEVGRQRLAVSVEIPEGARRDLLWQQLVARAPFFANYQAKVTRQISLAVLTPKA